MGLSLFEWMKITFKIDTTQILGLSDLLNCTKKTRSFFIVT